MREAQASAAQRALEEQVLSGVLAATHTPTHMPARTCQLQDAHQCPCRRCVCVCVCVYVCACMCLCVCVSVSVSLSASQQAAATAEAEAGRELADRTKELMLLRCTAQELVCASKACVRALHDDDEDEDEDDDDDD